MPQLLLRLLGAPYMERSGVSLTLPTRKTTALLAYLAVTGRPHRRDALAALLWPEADPARARGSLRHALSALGQALGEEWLQLEGETIALAIREGMSVDVHSFRGLLAQCRQHGHREEEVCAHCQVPLAEAAELYGGDLLTGFSLDDSPAFDEWHHFVSERLRGELASVLERLVTLHTQRRAWEPALAHAQRWVALDPLQEGPQRRLMQLYAWAGRRSAALRQVRRLVKLLAEELAAEPEQETSGLAAAIQAGSLPPPAETQAGAQALGPAPVTPAPEPELVAREPELARLARLLERALAGQGQVVLVSGEAGSGKTALLQTFLRQALAAHPILIVAGATCNAFTGAGDPCLPFRELLGQLSGDYAADGAGTVPPLATARRQQALAPLAAPILLSQGPDLVGAFVPAATVLAHAPNALHPQIEQIAAEGAGGSPPVPQEQLFAQTTQVLMSLAAQRPLLLVVDDLQWVDTASVNLLFHLARRIGAGRMLLVGAYRPHDLARRRGGEPHPLATMVHELQRYAGDIRIDLDQAQETMGAAFVEALVDQQPNRLGPDFRRALLRQTEGHPFFTVELLRGLQERGDLVRDAAGRWVEPASLDWGHLPERVEGVIAARVAQLDERLQETLAIASVGGDTFTAEALARVQGVEPRQMVRLLGEELGRRHQLVRAVGAETVQGRRLSRYRLRHHLFQRYLYRRLDAGERAYLHAEVGWALEALYGEQASEIALDLALHFGRAGHVEQAVTYWLQAAQQALRLSAHEETIAHCRQGLVLLTSLPHTSERAGMELSIQLTLGMALQALKGYSAAEAETAYQRALELYRELDERPELVTQLAPVLIGLGGYYLTSSRWPEAHEVAIRTLWIAEQSGDPAFLTAAYWLMGYVFAMQGLYAPGLAYLEKGIGLGVTDQPHMALHNLAFETWCLTMSGLLLWVLGFPDQARLRSVAAEEAARNRLTPQATAAVLVNLTVYYMFCDDAAGVLRLAGAALSLAHKYHQPFWIEAALVTGGWAKVVLGAADEGLDQIRQGMALQTGVEHGMSHVASLLFLAKALAATGQVAEALAWLSEAIAISTAERIGVYQPALYRLQGELLLMQTPAQAALAEEAFVQAVALAQRQEAKMYELRATVSLCRLWQRQDKRAEARERLAALYAWFSEGFDTPDLRQARALLLALADPQSLV